MSNIELLSPAIGRWMRKLDEVPGWRDWKRRVMRRTLAVDDPWPNDDFSDLQDFQLPADVSREHAVIIAFLGLQSSLNSLRDCEYYFRRYPFHGLPVSHVDHLRYVCEMYFGRFYEFKARLKVMASAFKQAVPDNLAGFGPLIKDYERHFKRELKERNGVNHHSRFDDIHLDNIAIIGAVAYDRAGPSHLRQRMRRSYRQAASEWADRVRSRSVDVELYLEAVASLLVLHCSFLDVATDEKSPL